MIALSQRFSLAALLLIALVFGLTTLRASRDLRFDDCAHPERLEAPDFFESLNPFEPVAEAEERGMSQWSEGQIRYEGSAYAVRFKTDKTKDLDVVFMRTFDPIKLYLFPQTYWGLPNPADGSHFEWIDDSEPALPIRWAYVRGTHKDSWMLALSGHMYIYRNEPVKRPFLHHLAGSLRDFVFGTRPLTMLVVKGKIARSEQQHAQERAVAWMRDATRRIQTACRPTEP